ncbi:MAG: amidohydrolase [Xanthomonadales bacterium]|nr:amidohydrolase [Xanthomonadales bacterium]
MRYLRVIGLAFVLTACGQEPAAPGDTAPKHGVTVIHNARIHTVSPAQSLAQAMAFSAAGEILAVGDSAVMLARFPAAQARDLQGRTVVPGLIDAHGHLTNLALSLTRAQLAGTRSKDEVIRRLKAFEAQLGVDDWLLGRGWDQNDWPVQEFPTRADLDRHFPDRPVWLTRIDGHAGWANSAALAMADRDLSGNWQVEGGYIHRDSQGQATGILVDGAEQLVEAHVPPTSEELMVRALGLAMEKMVSLGLTGVHDPGLARDEMQRYLRLVEAGAFPTRVYAMTDGAGATLDWLCEQGPLLHESGRFFARAVKLYGDGALGSRGAALLEDYADEPGNQGLLFQPDASLAEQVRRAMECGFQAAIHAIGDAANRQALDVLEEQIAAHPDNPGRHRIEHVQVLARDDIPRFAQLGVIASMQPTHATSDMYWAGQRLGSERSRYAYAWRALLDSGARLALGSDFPVEEVNPMLGIYAAVTRQDLEGWPEDGWFAEERLGRDEALRGFTLDAAYAGFMEHLVGSLEPGKRADFVVLDRDIMEVPARDIAATRVLETWLDGTQVFSAADPD